MRKVTPVTKEEISKVAECAMRKWKAGQPVYREMMTLRGWTTMRVFDDTVPDVNWMTDLTLKECPEARQFGRHFSAVKTGADPYTVMNESCDLDMMAALTWMTLCTLAHSDTPNWFRLSEGLTHQLMVTELRDVQAKDVQMPYRGFYVEMPAGLLYNWNTDTGWHEVRVIAVGEGYPDEDSVPGHKEKYSFALGRRLMIMACCEPNSRSFDPSDDSLSYFSLPLATDDAPIEELIQLERKMLTTTTWNGHKDKPYYRFGGRELSLVQGTDLLQSLVVNILLYLSSEGAEIEHVHKTKIAQLKKGKHAKRKKTKKRIQDLQNDRVFEVGSTIRVCPDIKKYIESGRKGPKFELKHRTLVRGHWRNQAHGPKRMLRKRIFIKPFVKKKDLVERVAGHNYEVE